MSLSAVLFPDDMRRIVDSAGDFRIVTLHRARNRRGRAGLQPARRHAASLWIAGEASSDVSRSMQRHFGRSALVRGSGHGWRASSL
jgi:hypothetical protein